MNSTVCPCLYCGKVTGTYLSKEPVKRSTVCLNCQWEPFRDEAREVAAGMRPWARPLHFFCAGTSMPDELAVQCQAKWDAKQAEISRRNLAAAQGVVPLMESHEDFMFDPEPDKDPEETRNWHDHLKDEPCPF
jgi:hypothetical protein